MGREKINRGLHITGGLRENPQLLTGKSTATTLTQTGPTFITVASATESATAAQYRFRLPVPLPGGRKTIAVSNNTTRLIQVVAATSGATFYGSTNNAVQFATGTTGTRYVEMIGFNSTTWAVLAGFASTAAAAASASVPVGVTT